MSEIAPTLAQHEAVGGMQHFLDAGGLERTFKGKVRALLERALPGMAVAGDCKDQRVLAGMAVSQTLDYRQSRVEGVEVKHQRLEPDHSETQFSAGYIAITLHGNADLTKQIGKHNHHLVIVRD